MINLRDTYLSILGYKKIPLHDTKGILNDSNNFKYCKESVLHYKSKTILPGGTKIIYKIDDKDPCATNQAVKETLVIKKKSGDVIKSIRVLGEKIRTIYKNGKLL